MSAQKKHVVETTFINAWVESGIYILKVNAMASSQMARLRIDLLDINHLLRTGRVVRSDMEGSRGLWDVRGPTPDGDKLEITITVVSTLCEVELLRIVAMQRR